VGGRDADYIRKKTVYFSFLFLYKDFKGQCHGKRLYLRRRMKTLSNIPQNIPHIQGRLLHDWYIPLQTGIRGNTEPSMIVVRLKTT
jgi:hypothetical protein